MFYFLIFILLFINNSITNAFECKSDEVYYEDSCYKLIKLSNFLNNESCSKINSNQSNEILLNQCIDYLEKVIKRLNKIYTNNLRLNDLYQFGFLDYKLRKATWEKIIKIYQSQNHENFNIFNNFYYYNNNHYVENQPSDDEYPNVMMHGSSSGAKCISGQKIHSSNESFSFYYDDCNKELPFICIKPYDSNIFSEDYELNDRCSYFDKTEPGGNWFECDKLSDDQAINLSKSHKCCMYNIKWRENFYDANRLCYKFDSVVFSLRLKGYKVILEKYATFLSINYVDSKYLNERDFFAFWTSCNSKFNDPDNLKNNEKFQCVQSHPTALMTSSILEHNDIKGIKINVLKIKSNQTVKNFYNLTFINLFFSELKNKTINNENIKLCNQESFATYSNKTISLLNKTMIQLNSADSLNSCLFKIHNMFDINTVYLGRRKSISYKIQTKTVRSNKYSLTNDSKCFHYSEINDKYYLSIPILNICYHFTIIDFKKINNLSINYIQSLNYSLEPNFDIELNELSHEISTIILNTIGIADFNECYSNGSISNYSVLITKDLCFNLISLIKFINKNDNYLNSLTTHLVNSNIVIRLHSFSFIKTVLHLACSDRAFKLAETIRKCSKFNDNKYCSFTCPSKCNNPSEVWQFKTNQFAYLNISNICYAAFHSNSLRLNRTEGKLYLGAINKDNKRLFVKNNGIYSNIWPPIYLKDNSLLKFVSPETGFSFASNENEISETNDYREEILLIVKAAYSFNTSLVGEKFDINAMLHSVNNYKFSNFNIKNLIKSDPKVAFSSSLNNKSTTLTLTSDKLFSLNNYYELIFNLNADKVASIKFPINFINKIEKIQNEQIIRLVANRITKTVKILYKSKNKTKIICNWYLNNQDSGISCFNSLSLSLNSISTIKDIQNELNIIYPNFLNEFKTFSRVFLSDNKSNSCKNGGLMSGSNSSNCLCLPGFSGNYCEKVCNQSYYGSNCQYNCLHNECTGYLICNIDPIGCSCASGYKGFQCDEPCSADLWGPNCLFKCMNCETCNSYTGKCGVVTISESSLKLILMWLLTFFLILSFAFVTKIVDERAEKNDDFLFIKPIELDQILNKTKLDF